MVPWGTLAGTELTNVVLRALGARIGRKVHIARGVEFISGGWDLLEIGNHVSIGQDAALRMTDLSHGQVIVGSVIIGEGATLDTRSGMGPGSKLAPQYICLLSMLTSRTRSEPDSYLVRVRQNERNGSNYSAGRSR